MNLARGEIVWVEDSDPVLVGPARGPDGECACHYWCPSGYVNILTTNTAAAKAAQTITVCGAPKARLIRIKPARFQISMQGRSKPLLRGLPWPFPVARPRDCA